MLSEYPFSSYFSQKFFISLFNQIGYVMVDEAGTAIGFVLRFVFLCFPVAVDNFSYIVSYKCFVLFSCASLLLWIIFSNIVSFVCLCAFVMDDFNCFTC